MNSLTSEEGPLGTKDPNLFPSVKRAIAET